MGLVPGACGCALQQSKLHDAVRLFIIPGIPKTADNVMCREIRGNCGEFFRKKRAKMGG